MKPFNQLREETLEEKLKASDPAGTYIHDFVHSDNPKFAGKSKAKRIQMALAASYGAKRNEEAEQIDEVLVGKMVKGADGKSKMTQVNISDDEYKKHKEAQDAARKKIIAQRQSNRNSRMEEEVEQIDEAEMKTKTAYVPYVYTDRHGSGFGGYDVHYSKESDAHAHLARHGHMDINGKKGWVEKHEIAKHPSGRWVDANHMRRYNVHEETVEEGIVDTLKKGVKALGKALGGPDDEGQRKDLQRKMGVPQTGKKPTSEEVEQIDELQKSTLGSYIKKASVNMANQASKLETTPMGQSDKAAGHARKVQNRQFGIKDAVARLTKEDSTYGARADKLLARSHQAHRAGDKDVGSRAHALFLKARDKHWSDPGNRAKAIDHMMSGANDYYKSKKPGQYTGD